MESKLLGEKGCRFKGHAGNGHLKSGCEPLQVGEFFSHVVVCYKSPTVRPAGYEPFGHFCPYLIGSN